MGRDDDLQTVGEFLNGKPKPTEDPHKYIDAKGDLTVEGRNAFKWFVHERLVPDDDCLLDLDDLRNEFECWGSKPAGLSVQDILYRELSDLVCSVPYSHFAGNGPNSELVTRKIRAEFCGDFVNGVRARLVDDLGIEPFDPTAQESTAVEFIVDKLLPLESVNMLVAKPGAMKTWLAYRIAIDVSQGRPVLGRFATKKGRAVVVDFEIGSKEVKRRLHMLGAEGRVLHVSHPSFDLNDERFWTELAKLRPVGPWIIVIDGLGAGQRNGVGELDSRFASPLGRAATFAEKHSAVFVFVHHSPKAASIADVESLFSGTGAIRRGVDSAYYFRRLPTGPHGEARAEVVPVKSRKGSEPARFKIQLTDARGVEPFDHDEVDPISPHDGGHLRARSRGGAAVPELSAEEKVLSVIVAQPGCSRNYIARTLEMSQRAVGDILSALERAEKIRGEVGGNGRPNAYFVTAPDTAPDDRSGAL